MEPLRSRCRCALGPGIIHGLRTNPLCRKSTARTSTADLLRLKCYKSPSNQELLFVWQDCLACSGCVTSAETVLLEHQSAAEFLSKLADPGITVVVSISPQSRAALAAFHGLSPAEALQKLTGFFKGQGVKAVLDTSIGRDFSLLEAAAEFVQRYRERHPRAFRST